MRELGDEGYLVRTIGRSGADACGGDAEGIRRLLDGADLLVNLAGKRVNCRYGAANRREIPRSRVETSAELARAVADSARPVPMWVNASTATVYRHATDRPQTESTGELGDDFSPSVGRAWERAFFAPELPATRRVALRIASVLGRDGACSRSSASRASASAARSSTAGSPDARPGSGPVRTTVTSRPTAARSSAGCTSTTWSASSASCATPRPSRVRSTRRAPRPSPTAA